MKNEKQTPVITFREVARECLQSLSGGERIHDYEVVLSGKACALWVHCNNGYLLHSLDHQLIVDGSVRFEADNATEFLPVIDLVMRLGLISLTTPVASASFHTPGKVRLYFHETSGGAEYLCSSPVKGTNEGSFDSDLIIRIDGDITKDAEVIKSSHDELLAALKGCLSILATINGTYLTPERAAAEPYSWGETRRIAIAAQQGAFAAIAAATGGRE